MIELVSCVIFAVLLGWVAEQWMTPTPISAFRRPWRANVIHVSTLFFVFGVYLLIFRRPWLAAALTLGLPILLIIINNTKYTHLREPFLASDWSYFIETLRYPNLFLPYFGKLKALLMLGGFLFLLVFWLWLEPVWGGSIVMLLIAGVTLVVGGGLIRQWACTSWPEQRHSHSYVAETDVTNWGLFTCLALYRHDLSHSPLAARSSFLSLLPPEHKVLPHFISIQAESFFDLHRNFADHLSQSWLNHWNTLTAESQTYGPLIVPAWGANTVRTEFAFLTGLSASELGVHQFQPYATAIQYAPLSLARYLRDLSYRSVFVHPYLKTFYNRHFVMPKLGFETFIDVTDFAQPTRNNEYVSDLAIGKKLVSLLNDAEGPTFLHAVTMAGHGPYTRKGAEPGEILDKYAARMAGTDVMLGYLREALPKLNRPVVLCLFGDHAPILPEVYAWLGTPDGTTDYVVWCSQPDGKRLLHTSRPKTVHAHALAAQMLYAGGFSKKPVL